MKLAENPRLKGVAFVAVTTEKASDSVRNVAREELKGWTVLRADSIPEVFATQAIPTTYVIALPDVGVVASEIGRGEVGRPSVVAFPRAACARVRRVRRRSRRAPRPRRRSSSRPR